MEKLTGSCPALFSLVGSRGKTCLGAEWEHSLANNGDNRILTTDASSRKARPYMQARTLTDGF